MENRRAAGGPGTALSLPYIRYAWFEAAALGSVRGLDRCRCLHFPSSRSFDIFVAE
jgi:hypothetical protein